MSRRQQFTTLLSFLQLLHSFCPLFFSIPQALGWGIVINVPLRYNNSIFIRLISIAKLLSVFHHLNWAVCSVSSCEQLPWVFSWNLGVSFRAAVFTPGLVSEPFLSAWAWTALWGIPSLSAHLSFPKEVQTLLFVSSSLKPLGFKTSIYLYGYFYDLIHLTLEGTPVLSWGLCSPQEHFFHWTEVSFHYT